MSDINELEKYFDILLKKDAGYQSSASLADDQKRFIFYKTVKNQFEELANSLQNISGSLGSDYSDYMPVIKQMAGSFHKLANISDEEMDYCIRTMAIDRVIKHNEESLTSEVLGYMIEGIFSFFFHGDEEILQMTKEAIDNLKDKKSGKFFKRKEDEELKQNALHVLGLYDEVEVNLKDAKSGIIAKDKKMLEVLRSLKVGLGKQIINIAIEQTDLKPKILPPTTAINKKKLGPKKNKSEK